VVLPELRVPQLRCWLNLLFALELPAFLRERVPRPLLPGKSRYGFYKEKADRGKAWRRE